MKEWFKIPRRFDPGYRIMHSMLSSNFYGDLAQNEFILQNIIK